MISIIYEHAHYLAVYRATDPPCQELFCEVKSAALLDQSVGWRLQSETRDSAENGQGDEHEFQPAGHSPGVPSCGGSPRPKKAGRFYSSGCYCRSLNQHFRAARHHISRCLVRIAADPCAVAALSCPKPSRAGAVDFAQSSNCRHGIYVLNWTFKPRRRSYSTRYRGSLRSFR